MDTVADRIRWLVKQSGHDSMRAFARAAGLTDPDHIEKILSRGTGERTGGDTLAKIAAAGGVTLDWLITGREPRHAPPLVQTSDVGAGIGRVPSFDEAAARCVELNPWVRPEMISRARLVHGVEAPNPMTPEYVLEAVLFVMRAAALRAQAEAGRSKVEAEIRKHKRDVARRARGKKQTAELPLPANDAAPKQLPAPTAKRVRKGP